MRGIAAAVLVACACSGSEGAGDPDGGRRADGAPAIDGGAPPGPLRGDPGSHDFGTLLVETDSEAFTWTVRNAGATASGPLSLRITGEGAPHFSAAGCEVDLQPDATCEVEVRFHAVAAGAQQAFVVVQNGAGDSAGLQVTGTGEGHRVSVVRTGTAGRVVSEPAGIDCGDVCTAWFPPQTWVILRGETENGSGSMFGGWSGVYCLSSHRVCDLYMVRDHDTTATFVAIEHNLVFVSSEPQMANLGSALAYDQVCNQLASAAGVNEASGNAFVAWISDDDATAAARLGAARGFRLTDGKDFADTVGGLLADRRILNPIHLDENGRLVGNDLSVMTGTLADGSTSPSDAADWTGAGNVTIGRTGVGAVRWTEAGTQIYTGSIPREPIYCFMKTKTAALPAPAAIPGARRIFLSNTTWAPGTATTPDARCQADRPGGVASARALLARTGAAASELLAADTAYVRPDGQLVGTGAQIVDTAMFTEDQKQMESGIWQTGDGNYPQPARVWTGSLNGSDPATAESSCDDWTSTSGSGRAGSYVSIKNDYWSDGTVACDGTSFGPARLYCIEE